MVHVLGCATRNAAPDIGVPMDRSVRYAGVYPGIDLIYYGNRGQLEWDFVVAPGADPKKITLAVETRSSKVENRQSQTRIAANGDLIVQTTDAGLVSSG
jgi:hypothetical protein